MKLSISFIIFILILPLAQASCHEFELLGEGLIEEEKLIFVVAKNTLSQTKLEIPIKDQEKLIPYVERWTRAHVILNSPRVDFNSKVIKVISAQYEIPDPLNLSSKTSMVRRKEVVCPKD